MADGHDAWYRRELDRGRRFHGAFAGECTGGMCMAAGTTVGTLRERDFTFFGKSP